MWKKKEEKKEEKEEGLLKELCGDDAKLYNFLSNYLYLNPLVAISKKDLDILTEEAEKSGNFRSAMIRPFSRPLKTRGKGKDTSKLSKTSRRRLYTRRSKKKKR
jgi:hypothetical protein